MERYTNTILNKQGKPVAGAVVTVTTYPGNEPATIYAADGGAPVQSVTSDETGRFAFYAADGHYSLNITGRGIEPITITDVVLNDPSGEASLAVLGAADGAALVGFQQAGTGAVPRKAQDKLRDVVSVKDFGAKGDGSNDAAAFLATAATGQHILVPNGSFAVTLAASDVVAVLSMLKRITAQGDLVINLPAGTIPLTSQVVVNAIGAHRITIKGAATISTTATAQIGVTGTAKDYSVTIGVVSSVGAAVGDYALVRTDVAGTGDFYAHAGVWKITAVDSGGANQLTLKNTHHGAAFPTNTLTGGTVVILKTVLQFTGCDGFRFEGGDPLGLLDRAAIVGDWNVAAGTGTTGAHGIIMASPVIANNASSNTTFNVTGGAALGVSVGVSAWGEQGICGSIRTGLVANFVASCSNRKRGIYAEGASFRAKYAICSGNGEDGFIADTTGFIQAAYGIASGNGLNGFWSTNNSLLAASNGKASGNKTNGFECRGMGRLAADSGTSMNNTLSGFACSDGGQIDADAAVSSGNGADGFTASSNCTIDCNNSSSLNNGAFGYKAASAGFINAAGTGSVSGNTSGPYSCVDAVLYQVDGPLNPATMTFGAMNFYNSARSHYGTVAVTSIGDVAFGINGATRLTLKASQGMKISGATPTSAAGELALGSSTATTVGVAGAAAALPATPSGYLIVGIAGTSYKLPYYAA